MDDEARKKYEELRNVPWSKAEYALIIVVATFGAASVLGMTLFWAGKIIRWL